MQVVYQSDPTSSDYKIYLVQNTDNKKIPISPFHDISTYHDESNAILNMVVEIPAHTNIKLEMNKSLFLNPITYDIEDNTIRKTKLNYPAAYGFIPQTFESPSIVDKHTGLFGDGDPVDVFDISTCESLPGSIIHIKILGIIAMIDDNETDWKIIGINVLDKNISNISRDEIQEKIKEIKHFLVNYKSSNSGTKFMLEDQEHNIDFAVEILGDTHKNWSNLMSDKASVTKSDTSLFSTYF